MKIDDIIKLAKYIQFPKKNNSYYNYRNIDNVHKLPLPNELDIESMYSSWKYNDNHFTTKYHRFYVLPLLNELFEFGYDINNFHLVEKMIENNNVSLLYPNNNFIYAIYSFNRNEVFENISYNFIVEGCDFNNNMITGYHKLYKYPHECSKIINNTINNNRHLFISGDSQLIPDIAILACYFKEVWYFDNRSNLSFKDKIEEHNFTDVLIELNEQPESKYFKTNFK